jgi:hypothetical protein
VVGGGGEREREESGRETEDISIKEDDSVIVAV